jgi:uncharacterized protein YkwD
VLNGIRPWRALPACALLCTLTVAAPAPASAARVAEKASFADAVVKRVNVERKRAGVRPLRRSAALTTVAGWHTLELSRLGRLDHASADGTPMSSRIRTAVRAQQVGETLAWLPPATVTPALAVSSWMQSPSHRASLLSPAFSRVGVARQPAAAGTFVAADLASAR